MKKTAIACAFFFLSFHATAQTYLSCDFENGIPNSFVLKDYDGNTPSEAIIVDLANGTSTTGINELSSGVDSNKAVVRYTVDGRRVAAPVKGINILKFADGRKEAGYGDFSCLHDKLKSPLRKRLRNQNPFFDKSQ